MTYELYTAGEFMRFFGRYISQYRLWNENGCIPVDSGVLWGRKMSQKETERSKIHLRYRRGREPGRLSVQEAIDRSEKDGLGSRFCAV